MMVQMPYAQPASSGMSAGVIVIIVVGVLLALGAMGGVAAFFFLRDDSSSASHSYSSGGGGGGSPATTSDPEIGDEVDVGDSTWTVIDTKDMGATLYSTSAYGTTKTTRGRFIQVHYKVVNNGKKAEVLLDSPKIVDSKSREFSAIPGEYEYLPVGVKSGVLESLQPSIDQEFYTIIEVPPDAKHLKVMLTALGLAGDHDYVDIDL